MTNNFHDVIARIDNYVWEAQHMLPHNSQVRDMAQSWSFAKSQLLDYLVDGATIYPDGAAERTMSFYISGLSYAPSGAGLIFHRSEWNDTSKKEFAAAGLDIPDDAPRPGVWSFHS